MTEAGKEGKHKCKICGEEAGPDKACDTKDCPNNREEGGEAKTESSCMGESKIKNKKWQHLSEAFKETPMENKQMKSFKIINEAAKGRLSRRMHRMLEVASNGRVLTEGDWTNRIGSENLVLAKQMGLLGAIEGKVLGEQEEEDEKKKKGGEAMQEQPPFGGGEEEEEETEEETPEFGGEEAEGEAPEFDAEEMEEEEEEQEPISMHELAKFLEALKDRADDEALAMIDKAVEHEEAMEGDEGEEGFEDDIAGEIGDEEGEEEEVEEEIVGEEGMPGGEEGGEADALSMGEDCQPCEGFLVIENGKIYVESEGQVVDESYVILEKSKEGGWPKHLKKGRFTSYCKSAGFDGPSVECAKKAMDSDDESVRGMASFYMNTVKPGGKDASAAKGKDDD
jgi:hypothetical protein